MLISANRIRPAFLASVTSADEAHVALSAGADIIDCKDPSAGALGALPTHLVREIVARVGSKVCVSATIGDLPSDPAVMVRAAETTAAAGVHYVKAGFFGSDDPRSAISALGRARLGHARLIAVLMADQSPDFEIICELASHRFAGVMIDTANKSSGALADILSQKKIAAFIALAKQHGLAAGLAGALRRHHIAQLVALNPDVLGFRGALCCDGRASALDVTRIAGIRDEISSYALTDLDNQSQRHALRI